MGVSQTARVTLRSRPADFADGEAAPVDIDALFAFVAPGATEPRLDAAHAAMAVAARNPAMALHLARLTTFLARDSGWARRPDLLELAIQAVNLHYGSAFGFEARLPRAAPSGLGLERLAAITLWRTSTLFDEPQRLLLGYIEAVLAGSVPDDLFARVRDTWGETETVELTTIIGTFALWAMLSNATGLKMPRADGPA